MRSEAEGDRLLRVIRERIAGLTATIIAGVKPDGIRGGYIDLIGEFADCPGLRRK